MDIEKRIIDEISKGIRIDSNPFDFALNMGFDIDFEELCLILSNWDHELNEDISSLVFSPDLELRKRFCLIWKDINLKDLKIDFPELASKINEVKILFKDMEKKISLENQIIEDFLHGFSFNGKIDLELINIISKFSREDEKIILLSIWAEVLKIDEDKTTLLKAYLNYEDFNLFFMEDEFSFFLNILTVFNEEPDRFQEYLMKLVKLYNNAYKNALETERFIENNNVETFLMQGGRVLSSNSGKISIQKHHLQNICIKFGLNREIFIDPGIDIVVDKNSF